MVNDEYNDKIFLSIEYEFVKPLEKSLLSMKLFDLVIPKSMSIYP